MLLPPPMPIEAAPTIIRSAIIEVIQASKAPDALVTSAALAAVSLACQNFINVQRLPGLVGPCSLLLTTLADSGERKSFVDSLLTKPFREFDEEQMEHHQAELLRYKAASAAWHAQRKALLAAIAKATAKGNDADNLTERLAALYCEDPQEPPCRKRLVNDISAAQFKFELRHVFSSTGLFSDEAKLIVDSGLQRSLAMQNKFWDGSTTHVERRTSGSFTIRDARVTTSLMFQPKVFVKHFTSKDSEARGIGYLARALIAYPLSTQGTRFIYQPNLSFEYLPRFHQRISELLRREKSAIDAGTHERKVLRFSFDAQRRWIDGHNRIESALGPGGCLSDIRDFGSKFADNVARIAALFHFFEGQEGEEISLDTLNRAITIGDWYLNEFKRLFSPPPPTPQPPQEHVDAIILEKCLLDRYIKTRLTWIEKSYLERRAPNSIRLVYRLNPAIHILINRGILSNVTQPPQHGKKPKFIYALNVAYFEEAARRLAPPII